MSHDSVGEPPRVEDHPFLFAVLGAGLVLISASAVVHLPSAIVPPPASYDGIPLASLVDVTPWRRFHETVLTGTALLGAAGLLVPRLQEIVNARAAGYAAAALALMCSVAIIASNWLDPAAVSDTYSIIFGERYGLLTSLSTFTYRTVGIVSCGFAFMLLRLKRIPDHWMIWAVILIYASVLLWPGLLLPIDLSRTPPGMLQVIEWHYDVFFGPKNDLVRGIEPIGYGYGFGLSLFAALIEKEFGPFSFSDDIRLVQIGNVVFSFLILAACYLWFRGRAFVALLTALLVLPWIHSLHQGIFFPNQSGWRFVFFPISLLAFAFGRRVRGTKAALAFGFVAAAAILWNPETGLPVLLGLSSYLVSRLPRLDIRSLAFVGGVFLLGAIAAIAATSANYLAALDHSLPLTTLSAAFVERLRGYPFGAPLSFDPLALVILASAIGAVLAGAWLRRTGPLTPDAAGALGSGVIILVWAAYYLQRSHPWNLWGYLLPFSIIIAAAWSSQVSSKSNTSSATRLASASYALGVAFTIGPAILASNIQAVASLYRAASSKQPATHAVELSGVSVLEADQVALGQRLAFLRSIPTGTLVFTANSYLLPKLLGRRDLFWLPDPAFGRRHDGGVTEQEFKALIDQIHTKSPVLILFEDEAIPGGNNFHQKFFATLRAGVGDRYRLESREAGWSLWRKRVEP